MNVIVFGSTGGSGRAVLEELVARGHRVTAFARRPQALQGLSSKIDVVAGDALDPEDVARALRGQDAVVVTLGISENPLLVRLRGTKGTPIDVRSQGTKVIAEAMRACGVEKLVVQSTYGVGETRGQLPLKWKLIFSLLLRPQIADTEEQERVVRDSGLRWVLVQPVGLTDDEADDGVLVSTSGETERMNVSRKTVARVLAEAAEGHAYDGQSVAVSAAA